MIRLALLQEHFHFGMDFLGITREGQIATRQKFISGEPPTEVEVTEFLIGTGIVPVKATCWLWKKTDPANGWEYWVGDARPENFVKTTTALVPIDLRMWRVPL